MKEVFAIGFIIGAACSVIITYQITWNALDKYQAKAVELGAAHWVVDQKTGKTTFTWKDQP